VVNATPRPLYPRERPGPRCVGGWEGLRAGLDRCRKTRPHWDSTSGPSSPLTSRYTDYAIEYNYSFHQPIILFITLGTLPTSRVAFTVTFTVFKTLSLGTKYNCRKNTELQHEYRRSKVRFNKHQFVKPLHNTTSVSLNFNLHFNLMAISTKSMICQLRFGMTFSEPYFLLFV